MTKPLPTLTAQTHLGLVRQNNEDAYLATPLGDGQFLLLVSDGVAGRDAGEVASATTVAVFRALAESGKLAAARDPQLAEPLLAMAVQKAHVEVSRLALESNQKLSMSCTLSVALVTGLRADLAWVGDSRIYLYRNGALRQLSEDQTVAWQLVKDGRLLPEQVAEHPDRNTLSQSIGLESAGHPLQPAHASVALEPGDVLLVCSDGLSDLVPDAHIAQILKENASPQDAVPALITAALDAGGRDNVTVVLAKLPMAAGGNEDE